MKVAPGRSMEEFGDWEIANTLSVWLEDGLGVGKEMAQAREMITCNKMIWKPCRLSLVGVCLF